MSTYSSWKNNIGLFIPYAAGNNAVYGSPKWQDDEGTINVIVIRNNEELSFNDILRNNDELIIFENRPNDSYREYKYKVTADPSTNKHNIAHLAEGAYESYVVRNHRWIAGRTALCQDAGKVKVNRTDKFRKLIGPFWGYFGINIHDTGGFWNSSLGCVILALKAEYIQFKELLLRAKKVYRNKNLKFSVFVINKSFLQTIH